MVCHTGSYYGGSKFCCFLLFKVDRARNEIVAPYIRLVFIIVVVYIAREFGSAPLSLST